MHELEKAKLVRHHAKRLRQLGADNELVEEVVARLSRHDVSSSAKKETAAQLPLQRIRRISPAKVCRGALGFRARQTRKHEYSIIKKDATETRSPASLRSKREEPPITNSPETQ